MRRGLVTEVKDAFASAIEMCGCMPNVELREVEEARLAKLCTEVLKLLREGDRAKRPRLVESGRLPRP